MTSLRERQDTVSVYVERDQECSVGRDIRALEGRSSRGVDKTVMR